MFSIKIAGITVCIHNRYPYVEDMCCDYVTEDSDTCFHVEVTPGDIAREQAEADVPCTPSYCESICIYRAISRRLIDYDSFLMHGACIEYRGDVYVFCAKSGVGKSTHLSLWKKVFGDAAHIINGDKPILRKHNGIYYVYGTPWCGKEGWNMNTSAPLKALCFLERGIENTIEPVAASMVMHRMCHQVLFPKSPEQMTRYLDMMDDFIQHTPCYLLHCNMEEEAAKIAYESMR
ncbi:MAG: hypothetical protein K2K09_00240 [Lachnospiraceae bacterium]|nr:hypothetical protein [Lachnospiraceae bacterium]